MTRRRVSLLREEQQYRRQRKSAFGESANGEIDTFRAGSFGRKGRSRSLGDLQIIVRDPIDSGC